MAVTPMNVSCLMSASDALTMAVIRALSANLTFMMSPLRALTVNIGPSTAWISPRIRTVCGCWAAPIETAKNSAKAITTAILNGVIVPPNRQLGLRAPGYNPFGATLFRWLGLRKVEIGLKQRPQFSGHFGLFAEPQQKAAHRLMHQHAEPVGGAQPASPCRLGQWRDQRCVNEIGDDGMTGQAPLVDNEFWLSGHAERCRVDNERRLAECGIAVFPAGRMHACAKAFAQRRGALQRAVGDNDLLGAAFEQRIDDRARRAAARSEERLAQFAVPAGRAGVEIVQESFDVGIGRAQHAVEPQRVGRADGARAIVRPRGGQRRFLVRYCDVGADIAVLRERFHECAEFLRADRLAPIIAGDAVLFQPVIMNERRARMFDRPADDASGASACVHAEAR